MRHSSRFELIVVVVGSACGGGGRMDSDSSAVTTSSTGVTAATTSTGTTADTSSGDTPTGGTHSSGVTSTAGTSTGAATTGGPGFCPIVCGPTNACCAADESCVADKCAPACASGVLCAGVCCEVGAVCVADSCAQPTGDCKESLDCEPGEFCEPTLEKCLQQFPEEGLCEFVETSDFMPALKWSWTQSQVQPAYVQAVSAPLVVDLDDDGTPEVIFTTKAAPHAVITGYMRVLDGATGAEKWDGTTDALNGQNVLNTTFSPAAADLEGDGPGEVVALAATGEVVAFSSTGAIKWRSRKPDDTPYTAFAGQYSSAISIADMDGDGKGEVVLAGVVLDHTGKVISGLGRELLAQVKAPYGTSSIIADVDGDTLQDVVGGNAAYTRLGDPIWTQAIADGYPAIADFYG